jgi:hypothetical protein
MKNYQIGSIVEAKSDEPNGAWRCGERLTKTSAGALASIYTDEFGWNYYRNYSPEEERRAFELIKGPAASKAPVYDYDVKSWPWFFEPMIAGTKKHDMRDMRDRPYKIGDRMLLREYDPRGTGYTGRSALAIITYITSNETPCAMSSTALDRNVAILSLDVSGPYRDESGA